jgi:hypothetical protein
MKIVKIEESIKSAYNQIRELKEDRHNAIAEMQRVNNDIRNHSDDSLHGHLQLSYLLFNQQCISNRIGQIDYKIKQKETYIKKEESILEAKKEEKKKKIELEELQRQSKEEKEMLKEELKLQRIKHTVYKVGEHPYHVISKYQNFDIIKGYKL